MKFLITAGPTREKIDDVRFLSNRSSGKMGYALANCALEAGHDVTLVSGPVSLTPLPGIKLIQVESAAEMACEVRRFADSADIIIMAAAVADYRPRKTFEGKLKKSRDRLTIELERTEDILDSLGKFNSHARLVGFAAEAKDLIANAETKLKSKHLDWIIANDISRDDRGFNSDQNAVVMLSADGEKFELPLQPKTEIARKILQILTE